MDLGFEWDEDKGAANLAKHDVSFEEAATVFADPVAAIFDDEAHSIDEHREIIIGYSAIGRLLIVCFTERPPTIRIISARKATKRERKAHEENKTH
jgi:uncharacterized DUF497 family protein